MTSRFKIVDIGRIKWLLGTEIIQEDNRILINQEKYANDVLKRFQMQDCKPATTLITTRDNKKNESMPHDRTEYLALVGSIMYLVTVTRPDIAYAASQVIREIICGPTRIWQDNQSTIRIISNRRTKYIEIKYHFTREKIENGDIDVDYLSTNEID